MKLTFYEETVFQSLLQETIPEDWEIVTLEEIAEDCKTGIPIKKQERTSGPYPYFGANGVIDYVHDYIFDGEYIIVAQDGSIGAIHYFNGKFWANNHVWVIRTNNLVIPFFLYYVLKKIDWKRLAFGSTRPKVTQNMLLRLKIPLPPLKEQETLVQILSVVDSAVELVDKVIAKTERLKKGLMQTLLTRGIGHREYKQTPIGTIPKEWTCESVGEIAKICRGAGYQYIKKCRDNKEGIPLIRINDFNLFQHWCFCRHNNVCSQGI